MIARLAQLIQHNSSVVPDLFELAIPLGTCGFDHGDFIAGSL